MSNPSATHGVERTSWQTSFIFGLWAPRTVVVSCAAGTAEAESVRILADAEGRPLAVESVANGSVVRTEVTPTPQPGVVMASIPVQENY